MPRRGLSTASMQLGLAGSVVLHIAISLLVHSTPTKPIAPPPAPPETTHSVELVINGPGRAQRDAFSELQPKPLRGGLQSISADTWAHGGTAGGAPVVVNLGSRVGELALRDVARNNAALDQLQRIRTSRQRRSSQRARQTPNPAQAAVLTTGGGSSDARDNRRVPTRRKTALPQSSAGDTDVGGNRSVSLSGNSRSSQQSARVAAATHRPELHRGRAATDTDWHASTPADNVDSTSASRAARVATIEQTPIAVGEGSLGANALDSPAGASSSARGPHAGPMRGPVGDAAYDRWLAKQRQAIGKRLRFPDARRLKFDQGISVFEVLIAPSGRVLSGPALVRSSGFSDFDHEGQRAILATPFAPLPGSLAQTDRAVRITMVVRFSNPMTF